MIVTINAQRKIYAIQEDFNKIFPYLKLGFFQDSRKKKGGLLKRMVNPGKTIGECSPKRFEGGITITPGMTVEELGESLEKYYGLGLCILRKSGNMWLETTYTGEWSFSRQNNEGESVSRELAAVWEPGIK